MKATSIVSVIGIGFCAPALAHTGLLIVENGYVTENPAYPYSMHGYYFDDVSGDNDLPWLREYASSNGIFDAVDLTADWKDREWAMMRAIIDYTSQNLSWEGSDTVLQPPRAKAALESLAVHPDWSWSCGTIAGIAIALAQAHGIPARRVGGFSQYGFLGDITMEMYSTRWNRWIHHHAHGGQWIEDQRGPLGVRELHEYDLMGGIIVVWTGLPGGGGYYRAINYPPLMFLPSNDSRAPIYPQHSTKFWSGYYWHMSVWYEFMVQSPVVGPRLNVVTDELMNEGFAVPRPIVDLDDPGLTYPVNNVEASILQFENDSATIALKNNMFDFVEYEHRVDGGPWSPLVVNGGSFVWSFDESSTLEIRGVGVSGAHSPDVVVRTYEFDEELIGPCTFGPGAIPSPSCLPDLDLDSDGDVDLRDYSIVMQLY